MRRLALILCFAPAMIAAETKWIRTQGGPVEMVSDTANKVALPMLGAVEQFRFALGSTLGKPDLASNPPVQLWIEKQGAASPDLQKGRTRYMVSLRAGQPVTPAVFHNLAHLYLTRSVPRLPPELTAGLEQFLSTVQVEGAHVIWGAPPPEAQRTLDWARIHLLATKPEYYGKLKVLLSNLENGVEEDVALRNAIGKNMRELTAEAEIYRKGSTFGTADGPSEPLNPLRDFAVKPMADEDVRLGRADVLDSRSEAEYQAILKANVHVAEAEEGLAILAQRRNDDAARKEHIQRAIDADSTSAWVWVQYAEFGPNRGESVEKALALDPQNAEAQYLAGMQKDDAAHLKLAATLEPQNVGYWDSLAQTYVGQKKFAEARKAWRSAEQASDSPEQREHMRAAWLGLEERKLQAQDTERQESADRLEQLKAKSIAELHAAENKINSGTASSSKTETVAEWDDVMPISLEGKLKQVDCVGKQTRAVIETVDGKQIALAVRNRRGLTCGLQHSRPVKVEYERKPDARLGTAGVVESLPE